MHRNVLFTVALLIFSFTQLACQSSETSVVSSTVTPLTPLRMKFQDVAVGDGRRAMWGQIVTIKYVGKLPNGTVFDQGKMDYKLGDQNVIKGFNIGIGGSDGIPAMNVAGKRVIEVPPELGYGKDGDGRKIPPNAMLTFELELMKAEGGVGF